MREINFRKREKRKKNDTETLGETQKFFPNFFSSSDFSCSFDWVVSCKYENERIISTLEPKFFRYWVFRYQVWAFSFYFGFEIFSFVRMKTKFNRYYNHFGWWSRAVPKRIHTDSWKLLNFVDSNFHHCGLRFCFSYRKTNVKNIFINQTFSSQTLKCEMWAKISRE